MANRRILLSSPHMGGQEQKYVQRAFETNWVAPLGPNVDEFEQLVAAIAGVKAASAVSSGTSAIHLGLRLLGVGEGDVVIAPSFTFIASVNPVLYLGARPVLVDSEPNSWNMSPVALRTALEDLNRKGIVPKAIIVVNLYGQVAMFDEIRRLADEYGVPILEDSAESLGSVYRGRPSGSLGNVGVFSFNGNKIITTSGGGALVSNDEDLIDRSRFLATQARDPAPYYQHSVIGYNYRLSNVSAGIGLGQLEVLAEHVERRRAIFERYAAALGTYSTVGFQTDIEGNRPNRWLTAVTFANAAGHDQLVEVMQALDRLGIEARLPWKPLHLQPLFADVPYYADNDSNRDGMSVSERVFEHGLCLPSSSSMTDDDQDFVIDSLVEVLANRRLL